jgi:predicted adenylyl cyclase CyaB
MLPGELQTDKLSILDILKRCVLIRDIDNKVKKMTYKYKKYSDNGGILEQGKVECNIDCIDDAKSFLEGIGYQELFKIYDKITVYSNGINDFAVQQVEEQGIYIEMEQESEHISNNNGNTIEEMIANINKYELDIDKSNYFVKKAEVAYKSKVQSKKLSK